MIARHFSSLIAASSLLVTLIALGTGLFATSRGAEAAQPARASFAMADAAPQHFPIEVLGPAGITRSVVVNAPSGASATKLWLQIHSLNYVDKASVRVNNGSWISLNNTTADVYTTGKQYGGIGGAFITLKLTVNLPAGAAVNGNNTIEFRFNFTDGESMGFRVLNLNLLDASGNRLIPLVNGTNKPLPEEDPNTWQPPLNTPADIAEGARLWNTRNIMVESPLSNGPVRASCGDCHSQSGYDLKFFNYSNRSVAGRSVFHGLTQLQGDQIASFIRSVPVENPGRPWNPPYQPGPGLDAKGVDAWAAGAGIDAVLDEDNDTRNYLPGGGTDPGALLSGARFKRVNVREIPIALQLPDWNNWLPHVHPLDSDIGGTFTSTNLYQGYARIRQGLDGQLGMSKDEYVYNGLRKDFDTWTEAFFAGADTAPFNQLGPYDGPSMTRRQVKQKYGAAVWSASKIFEIMHEYELETKSRELYGLNAEDRQWFQNRHLFNLSPNLMKMTEANFPIFGQGSTSVTQNAGAVRPRLPALYLANAWYHLQLLLNPGVNNAVTAGIDTMDWDYTRGLMSTLWWETGASQSGRSFVFTYKAYEQADDGYGPDGRGKPNEAPLWGWDWRDNTPWLQKHSNGNVNDLPNQAALKRVLYQTWLEKSGTYTADQWAQSLVPFDFVFNHEAPPSNYVIPNWNTPDENYRDFASLFAFHMRYARTTLALEDAISNNMAALGKTVWPNNPWDSYKRIGSQPAPTGVNVSVSVDSATVRWNAVAGATSYNVKRSDSAAGPYRAVKLFVAGTEWVERDLDAGKPHFYKVSANFGTEETADSANANGTPQAGLVGYWSFNESSGSTANDGSVSANHGELLGATRIAGKVGRAVDVGVGRFVGVDRNLRALSGDFTLAAWVRTSTTGNDDLSLAPALAGSTGRDIRYGGDTARQMILGAIDAQGRVGVRIGSNEIKSTAPINSGQWRHIAIVRNASNGQVVLYVDGVAVGNATMASGNLYQRMFTFGRPDQPARANSWMGGLDEVRLYNRPLNASEVSAVFNGTANEAAVLSTTQLDAGVYGSPYSVAIGATGLPAPTISAQNLPPGLSLSGDQIVGTPTQAGAFSVTLSASNGVGAPSTRVLLLQIGKAALTVYAVNLSRPLGQPNPALSVGYSGLVNGDTSAVLTGAPVLNTSATQTSPAGVYPITIAIGTLASGNYALTLADGTLTVLAPGQPTPTPGPTVTPIATPVDRPQNLNLRLWLPVAAKR